MMWIIRFAALLVLGTTMPLSSWACHHDKQPADETQPATILDASGAQVTEGAQDGKKSKVAFDSMPAPGTKAFCPVMKQEFEVAKDSLHSTYKGKTYVFCCPGCKPMFDKDPEKYLK